MSTANGTTTNGTRSIELTRVTKRYETPAGPVTALREVSLVARRGELLAVVGASGSGKSTLLALLAGIDRPTSGEVRVGGMAVHTLSERALTAWRGRAVGIVFQFFQLLPTLTVEENVMLPMDLCGTVPPRERRGRALALLERVGIAHQAERLPSTLSGGQQQRVAIARALANQPAVLLADEPTGNLDSTTAGTVLELLGDLALEGQTVVLVSHDPGARSVASRVVTLFDGCVVDGEPVPTHA